MTGGFLSRLARVQFTVGYAAVLLAVSCALLVLGPHAHDLLVQRASTNVHNLSHGHFGTLLGSAVVVDAGPLYFWLPFLTCLLALAELHFRTTRLVVAFFVGHVGATLLVAVALAAAIQVGWVPSSVARASDVGMSYGALAVLGAMTAALPRRWRPAWIGWWVAVGLAAAVIGGDFTDAGHTVAMILGVLVSTQFRAPVHWTPVLSLMLAASAGFGFLVLAHHWGTMAAAPVCGALGAYVACKFAQSSSARSGPAIPAPTGDDSLTGPQPVMAA